MSGGRDDHCYAFPDRPGVEASDVMITGIILGCHRLTFVSFSSGSVYSYMSTYFSLGFDFSYDSTSVSVDISTPIGEPLVVVLVYQSCFVTLAGYKTWVDLIILDMVDFDIILGID